LVSCNDDNDCDMRASVGLFLTSPKDPKPVIQQTTILLYVFFSMRWCHMQIFTIFSLFLY
jgi:hypothetical protein